MLLTLSYYLIPGFIAGLFSGWFGLGGGLVIVPVLSTVFLWENIHPPLNMHLAIGSSFANMFFTSLYSSYLHHRKKLIDWGTVYRLLPLVLIGALVGAFFTHRLSTTSLSWIFSVFILFVLIRQIKKLLPTKKKPSPTIPSTYAKISISLLMGTISGLLGIGIGIITNSYFTRHGMSTQKAAGIASAMTPPIALLGAISALLAGASSDKLPFTSTGYIYWGAVFGILIGSMFGVKLGTWASTIASERFSSGVFLLFLLICIVRMTAFS